MDSLLMVQAIARMVNNMSIPYWKNRLNLQGEWQAFTNTLQK